MPSWAAMSRMDAPRAVRRRMTSCCSTGGEVVVGDVVAGEGAFHGDLVDVVRQGGSGGRRGERGVGVDVVPGQWGQPAVCGGVGSGGVGGGTLFAGPPWWRGVAQAL